MFARLSRAAAKGAAAKLRTLGLLTTGSHTDVRLAACNGCEMRKVYAGQAFCGRPFLKQLRRDTFTEGCGCPINDKAADPSEHCPRHNDVGECACPWCVAERATSPSPARAAAAIAAISTAA